MIADRATAALGLRRLAPTVLVAEAGVSELLEGLREAGYAPAAESADGELITLGIDPPARACLARRRARWPHRGAAASDAAMAELVRRIRAGECARHR